MDNQNPNQQTEEETIAQLRDTIAAHEKTIDAQQEKIDRQELAIESLTHKNEQLLSLTGKTAVEAAPKVEKKKPELPAEPVAVDGKKYRFAFAAFYFKAVRYEAKDAALDTRLLKEILADKGQAILKEVY